MVAITASLVVCAGAYTLAKSSLEVFQHEARMNAAQYNNVLAMNRLVTDVKRAGFMSSPDASTDPQVCAPPPAGLAKFLIAADVTEGAGAYDGSEVYPTLPGVVTAANGRAPDRLSLSGNYTTSDRFKVGNVDLVGNKIAVEVDQLPVQRNFRDHNEPSIQGPDFCSFFPKKSIARLVDVGNRSRFIEVADCVAEKNPSSPTNYSKITITAADIPESPGCSEASGGYINPVDVIEYVPAHLDGEHTLGIGPQLIALMDQDATMPGIDGDASRLSLVRFQRNADGTIRTGSQIVADYIADLNFSAQVASAPLTPNVLTYTTFDAVGAVPKNQIRSLGIRLSTRARYPDREEDQPVAAGEPLRRFNVFDAAATNRFRFARVRTFFTEATISNLQGVTPWL